MLKDKICQHIADDGGQVFYVGGYVRDTLLGLNPKDVDIEVFDMSPARLKQILTNYGSICEVGVAFGIIKLRTVEGDLDFCTPRRENKIGLGNGHRGFIAAMDPTMSVAEAASRRDFTINAIYKDAVTGEVFDFFDGVSHLNQKKLVAVSTHFIEDPLRVLRGMQFASRFNTEMYWDDCTAKMCREMANEYNSLPIERIGEEWRKWTQGSYPSKGLDILDVTTWEGFYPAIHNMRGVPQDPEFHPEGNVYIHSRYVCDEMAKICNRENITGEAREVLMFSALTHDMGKPSTTIFDHERWRSPGHAEAGVPIAKNFLKSIGVFDRVIERVLPLVAEHMFPTWIPQTRRTVRRLKLRLEPATFDELLLLMESDASGRPPYPPSKPTGYDEIVALAAELPPKIEPLVSGSDIMKLGVKEGREIGRIKKIVFEAQMDEAFESHEDGIGWLKQYLVKEGFTHV